MENFHHNNADDPKKKDREKKKETKRKRYLLPSLRIKRHVVQEVGEIKKKEQEREDGTLFMAFVFSSTQAKHFAIHQNHRQTLYSGAPSTSFQFLDCVFIHR